MGSCKKCMFLVTAVTQRGRLVTYIWPADQLSDNLMWQCYSKCHIIMLTKHTHNHTNKTVSPLVKKLLLDPEIVKHVQPISNLLYLFKLVDKTIDIQIVAHCKEHGLEELLQSGYKRYNRTGKHSLKCQCQGKIFLFLSFHMFICIHTHYLSNVFHEECF